MKELLIGVSAIVGIVLLTLVGIQVDRYLQKQAEITRTQVMKESQSNIDGMRLQLNNQCVEYNKADTAGRVGIKNMVQDTFASVDTSDYPTHLQQCLQSMGVR